MSAKAVLEVTQEHKERVAVLAVKSDASNKEVTKAILGWALPMFEEGGDLALKKSELIPTKTEGDAA